MNTPHAPLKRPSPLATRVTPYPRPQAPVEAPKLVTRAAGIKGASLRKGAHLPPGRGCYQEELAPPPPKLPPPPPQELPELEPPELEPPGQEPPEEDEEPHEDDERTVELEVRNMNRISSNTLKTGG